MLQQTQVTRVEQRWLRWLERWPTASDLAAAALPEVIREWSGLGYNNRAVRLWKAAIAIHNEHEGVVPRDVAALRKLPGVGDYTAAAVTCFSESGDAIPVDVNVGRVLARTFHGVAAAREVRPATLGATARELAGGANHRDTGLALMDLGATTCLARAPRCDSCPLHDGCRWRAAGMPEAKVAPVPAPRFETTARFARGRIVAALGDRPHDRNELLMLFPEPHRQNLDRYLDGLVRDGLVEVRSGEIALAGDVRG